MRKLQIVDNANPVGSGAHHAKDMMDSRAGTNRHTEAG